MSSLYRRYKVNAVTIELTLLNQSVASNTCIWGILPPGAVYSTTGNGNAYNLGEKPFFTTVTLLTRDGGHCSRTVRYKLQSHQLVGLSKKEYAADTNNYSALVSASPSRYPTMIFNSASSSGNAVTAEFSLKITYHAEFWERVALATSS
jgi:hypothetical protein